MKSTNIVLSAIALCFSIAGSAGEITGGGKSLKNPDGTLNGASICAFSGLNDEYYVDHIEDAGRTQNWGQIPKDVRDFLVTIGFLPGDACNPTKPTQEP